MIQKTIAHPITGGTLKLGRKLPPPSDKRRMHLPLRKYIRRQMPKPPTRTNYRAKAQACLSQMLQNDRLGCCTASGAFHILGVWYSNAVGPVTFTDNQVIDFYARSTGYKPGDPSTDQGGDEVSVLDCWRDHGLIANASAPWAHRKILGHLSVNAANLDELKLAVWLFEHGYGGASLPDDAVGKDMPSKSGDPWPMNGPPNPANGHCPPIVDYDGDDAVISTWGMTVATPLKDIARLFVPSAGGEMHVAISADMLDRVTHKAPSGFSMDELKADLAAFAN